MSRWMIVVSLVTIVAGQSNTLAFCPSSNPTEILCEDFDTYCAPNQYPGGAGVPMGTQCAVNSPTTGNDPNLRAVWAPTSACVPLDTVTNPPTPRTDLPIPQLALDNAQLLYNSPYYYAYSRPFGARSPSRSTKTVGDPLPQHSFKDWSTGERNFSRFIQNRFGNVKYKAVMGTDTEPLVLQFLMDSQEEGKIAYSNGFIELAYGDASDYNNRANTDYALTPNCAVSCNGNPGRSVRYPVICDLWNPVDGIRFNGCPNPTIVPPPRRNAIAVGVLPMINVGDADKGPCYCGSSQAHGGQNWHPVIFNGQVWYDLRDSSPIAGNVHTITDMNGTPATPPITGVDQPLTNVVTRHFVVWGDPPVGGSGSQTVAVGVPYHWCTLTIKSNTMTFKFVRQITTISSGQHYLVTDELANIPLAYNGPFDSLRIGVGPGCQLASNSSWNCAANSQRSCVAPMVENGYFVEFDDISLYGGKGWTPAGACCLSPSGACVDEKLPSECAALGGTHKGGGTLCSDELVYCCPTPYADADADGDVDADDFGALQVCYTGEMTVDGRCSCFDRNGDGKVNQTDVALFANCATGPGITLGGECP